MNKQAEFEESHETNLIYIFDKLIDFRDKGNISKYSALSVGIWPTGKDFS